MEVLSGEGAMKSTEETVCRFCLKEKSQYTCPRCNAGYCSLSCYKCLAHASCSEAFYRDCFMEGLKDMKSPEDKSKVIEMLKRVAEKEDPLDSDDEDDDLGERMKGIDLDKDTELVWSRLTEKEKAEFKAMLLDGRLGELLTVWQPWWHETQKAVLVEEVHNDTANNSSVARAAIPPILTDIPDLSVLLKGKSPAETIRYNLVNVIYGYAYISRLYNGDYQEYPSQCAQELLQLCPALGNTSYNSASEAIHACIDCLANQARSLYISRQFTVAIIDDTQQIIHGPGPHNPVLYMAAALSELHRLYTEAKKTFNEASKTKKSSDKSASRNLVLSADDFKKLKEQCFRVIKKLEFMLSWLKTHGYEMMKVEPMLQVEFCEMSSQLAAHTDTEDKLKQVKEKISRTPTNYIEQIEG